MCRIELVHSNVANTISADWATASPGVEKEIRVEQVNLIEMLISHEYIASNCDTSTLVARLATNLHGDYSHAP